MLSCVLKRGMSTARSILADSGRFADRGAISLRYLNDCIAIIELNNPRASNAISCRMMIQFSDIIDELEKWPGQAVILSGSGSTFCAGADLGSTPELFTEKCGRAMSTIMTGSANRLRALPLISVAAIHGAAIGGGAELSTACDYRIMSESAFMQWVHVSRGVVPVRQKGARM